MKASTALLLTLLLCIPVYAADSEVEQLKETIHKLNQRIRDLEEKMRSVEALLNIDEPIIENTESKNRTTIHSKGNWSVSHFPDRRQVGLHRFEIAEVKGYLKNITVKVWHKNFDREAWSTKGQKFFLKTPDGKTLEAKYSRPLIVLYKATGWHTVNFASEVPLYTGEYEFVIVPPDAKTDRDKAPFTITFKPQPKN
ncbi:MAG: hypothetical protein ACF8OB_06705 [Phycisphaeraceae bacterium JB051]